MVQRSTDRQTAFASVALAAAAALAGCGSSETAPDQDAEAFAEAFVGLAGDYDPVSEPAVLASQSEVVISGIVRSVGTGRTFARGADDPAANTSVVLEVEVEAVESGTLNPSDTVYVEIPSPGGRPASYYQDRLPEGLATVMYLDEAVFPMPKF